MLGDFIIRFLVMLLGYAYPAFECYKTVEKNKVEIEELRFWCQYWILVAILAVFERVGDILISWLPMYGELKLGLYIYLWYPKTRGTGYVYGTLLRPYMAKHETDIDRKILELRARVWDFFIYYWQICAQLGQTKLFQIFQYMVAQSAKFTSPSNQKADQQNSNGQPQPQPEPAATGSLSFLRSPEKQPSQSKKFPPPHTPAASTIYPSMSESPKSNARQVHHHNQAEAVQTKDSSIPDQDTNPSSPMSDKLHQTGFRLRRTKPQY